MSDFITLDVIRRVARELQANAAKPTDDGNFILWTSQKVLRMMLGPVRGLHLNRRGRGARGRKRHITALHRVAFNHAAGGYPEAPKETPAA